MGWLGKMVGGTIGFMVGGPIGAIAGATFGHTFVDSKIDDYLIDSDIYKRLSYGDEAQLTFFVTAFSMLAKISKVDGRVSEKEVDLIDSFMQNDLHLDPQSRLVAINIFREAINSPQSFDAFAVQFYYTFNSQPPVVDLMMDILLRVSFADGVASSEKEKMLLNAAQIFHYSPTGYAALKSRYFKEAKRSYAVLQCDEKASNEEIKKQYRRLVSEYHPDKVASKGLSEEFTKFANDKFREVQEAYNNIKKERKIT
ncbi:MAG: TerB family tellurite resistance protein [Desulfamplus sp.]|nr:TerB family tellurite resistance protein [Desulfamplus sp.]